MKSSDQLNKITPSHSMLNILGIISRCVGLVPIKNLLCFISDSKRINKPMFSLLGSIGIPDNNYQYWFHPIDSIYLKPLGLHELSPGV